LFGGVVIVRSVANIPHNNEQSTSAPFDVPGAISLLSQALGSRATVEWSGALAENDVAEGDDPVITVRWAAAKAPRRIRLRAIERAGASTSDDLGENDVVLVLTKSTASHREALRTKGVSFIDLGGAVHLELPWALIDRADLPPAPSPRPRTASVDPFADKSSRILRTMFAEGPTRTWGVRQLAGVADVAVSTTSDVVRALEEREFVAVRRVGRAAEIRLADPEGVIETWTHVYDWRMNRSLAVHPPIGDVHRFLKRLPDLFHKAKPPRWALTLQAGASLRIPHATWDRVYVYVDVADVPHANPLAAFAAKMGWESGPDGQLVLLEPYYRTTTWDGMVPAPWHGVPVVSDLQLVLDLWNYPLRGREQAQVLLGALLRGR
jgi:hypothetical protein